ncbi:MAG TPA: class I SAM-dependent methyltransferase [Blastocatellia bacterium]|nr:class I SAM-dependent methyltransferase [Blastocatellia bacterium]
MGVYSKYIFPFLLEWSLGRAELGEQRRLALAPVRGETLEIGFGTALNLPYYPQTVNRLTMIDSEEMLPRRVEERIRRSPIPVATLQFDATGHLPFDDQTFDTVVMTLTLCSISDPEPALAQVRRVLKPGGQFVFFEHGRSADPDIVRLQNRFSTIHRIIGAGCNLNRPIDQLIESSGLEITILERFQLPNIPRILAEVYRGVARST